MSIETLGAVLGRTCSCWWLKVRIASFVTVADDDAATYREGGPLEGIVFNEVVVPERH